MMEDSHMPGITALSMRASDFVLERAPGEAYFRGQRLDLDADALTLLQALLDADGATLDAASVAPAEGAARLWATVARLNEALARCAPHTTQIAHFPGQGYRLVGRCASGERMLGRTEELAHVAELLQAQRFVTITGPGGIGKTTLARAVAAHCAELYPDGIRFIDLAALAEGREVFGALGAALGIARLEREGLAQLGASLRGRRMLVLFDSCEHHTGAAAEACEALLRAASGIDLLCTSREALLANRERIVRLGPIGLPDATARADALAAARYPGVQLFVARVRAADPAGFVLDEGNVALVCAVCRAVEGVPLALELAAALVRPLGLPQLAQRTSRSLLSARMDEPPPGGRHRSLSSMLDWSYDALAPHEQQVLRALAVFRSGFTLEAAAAVAAPALDADEVANTVIELAAKSLVSMGEESAYRPRLLDLTREYALGKLAGRGELAALQERHARWMCTLVDRLERDWMLREWRDWVALYGPWVDDILAAIDWALGPGAQPLLGAHMAAIGFSLGDQVGIARDFHERVRRALRAIAPLGDVPPGLQLRLSFADAAAPDLAAVGLLKLMGEAEWVARLARDAGSPMLQGASLVAIWGHPYVRGDYPGSLASARRIARAARDSADPYLALIGQRTMAQSLHFMGRHAEARRCAEQALAGGDRRIPLAYQPSPVQVGTSVRIVLARLLWMEGAADQALAMSEEALARSESDRPSAMCQVLAMAAVPVALWRGETARGAALLRRLRERAERHGMGFWIEWAQRFEDALAVIAGRVHPQGLPSFADRHESFTKCRDHLVTFSGKLLSDEAIRRCEAGTVAWCLPELLRAQAARRIETDAFDADGGAAMLLRRSLTAARGQGALAWSLRSASTLAELYLRQENKAAARATLEPVLARCREGRATADLRAACALMGALE